ncbi:hypothetical protein BDZ89DRAFT_209340 [Hymenopellis radicata]|nr:hypothetical protein BDZ89DRAFT_209340 [Hymenopellis radicata]
MSPRRLLPHQRQRLRLTNLTAQIPSPPEFPSPQEMVPRRHDVSVGFYFVPFCLVSYCHTIHSGTLPRRRSTSTMTSDTGSSALSSLTASSTWVAGDEEHSPRCNHKQGPEEWMLLHLQMGSIAQYVLIFAYCPSAKQQCQSGLATTTTRCPSMAHVKPGRP